MAQDVNGDELHVGDVVNMKLRIVQIEDNNEYNLRCKAQVVREGHSDGMSIHSSQVDLASLTDQLEKPGEADVPRIIIGIDGMTDATVEQFRASAIAVVNDNFDRFRDAFAAFAAQGGKYEDLAKPVGKIEETVTEVKEESGTSESLTPVPDAVSQADTLDQVSAEAASSSPAISGSGSAPAGSPASLLGGL